MSEAENIEKPKKKKPRKHLGRGLLLSLLIILSGVVLFQLVFLFYSDQLFGRITKEVIYQTSNEVYRLDYDEVKFNVFKNEIGFKNFQLKADSQRFVQLLNAPQSVNRLVNIKIPDLNIKGPSFLKLIFKDVLEISQFYMREPEFEISIYGGFRGSKTGWRNFHEQLSELVSLLRVDEFLLEKGQLSVNIINKKEQRKINFTDIDGQFTGFRLKRSEADSTYALSDFKLSLGENQYKLDSLNTLSFNSLKLGVKDSALQVNGLKIETPDSLKKINRQDLLFSQTLLSGVDFKNAYFNNNFKARQLRLDSGKINYERFFKGDDLKTWQTLEKIFDTVEVAKVQVNATNLAYKKHIEKPHRDLFLPFKQINLSRLFIDSNSFFNNKKKFFAKHSECYVDEFDIYSKDSSRVVSSNSLYMSTLKREILLFNVNINSLKRSKERSDVNGSFSSIQFFGVDPLLYINKNEIICRAILLDEPKFVVRQAQKAERKKYSNSQLNELVKQIFARINSSNVEVTDGSIVVENHRGSPVVNATGVDAYANGFATSAGSSVPENRLLLSNWFNVETNTLNMSAVDGIHDFTGKNVKFFSKKGGIYASTAQLRPNASLSDSLLGTLNHISDASFENLTIEGFSATSFLNDGVLNADFVESKGDNALSLEFNDTSKSGSSLNSLLLKELYIDSLKTKITSTVDGNLAVLNEGLHLKLCDLAWDTSMPSGYFDAYSIMAEGGLFKASAEKLDHRLEAKRLKINSAYKIFQLSNMQVEPLAGTYKGQPQALWLRTPQFRFTGVDLVGFFNGRKLNADAFYCLMPKVSFHNNATEKNGLASFLKEPFKHSGKLLGGGLRIKNFRINDGEIYYNRHESDGKEIEHRLEDVSVYMGNLEIDTFTSQTDTNFFFAQESEIRFARFEQKANDTSMIFSVGKTVLRPSEKTGVFEDVVIRNRIHEDKLAHFSLSAEEVVLDQLGYHELLVNKSISSHKIIFKEPILKVGAKGNKSQAPFFEKELPKALTKNYQWIRTDSLLVENGTIEFRTKGKNRKLKKEQVPGWNATMVLFDVNRNIESLPFLYSRYIQAELRDYSKKINNGLDRFALKNAKFDISRSQIYLDSFALTPLYEKQEYAEKKGKQTDRIDLFNMATRVSGFDFKKWLYFGEYDANFLDVYRTQISVYRDKSVKAQKGLFKEMPQDWLRELPIRLNIDTMRMHNWYISYEEKEPRAPRPGFIDFSEFRGTVSGISNHQSKQENGIIKIDLSTKLMESGQVSAQINVPLQHKNDSFSYRGTLSEMDMDEMNPILENLAYISIEQGKSYGIKFNGYADRYIADGEMDFYYSNLKVAVLDQDSFQKKGVEESVLSFLANTFIVRTSNKLFPRKGKIFVERNPEKSIFNYGAKALISGLKNTIGIQKRQQKQERKAYEKKLMEEMEEEPSG